MALSVPSISPLKFYLLTRQDDQTFLSLLQMAGRQLLGVAVTLISNAATVTVGVATWLEVHTNMKPALNETIPLYFPLLLQVHQ